MHYTAAGGWQNETLPPEPSGGRWGLFRGIDIKGSTGWIVGPQGTGTSHYFWQFDGTDWHSVAAPSVNAADVSVVDANEAWAVATGLGQEAWLAHYWGGTWSVVTATVNVPAGGRASLLGIHMLTATEGWAVGNIQLGTSGYYSCLLLYPGFRTLSA